METIVATKAEAEEVIKAGKQLKERWGELTVYDLYSLVSIQGTFKDDQKGWTDISTVRIEERDAEFAIIFPEPVDLRYRD